jgi:hypothetical protein
MEQVGAAPLMTAIACEGDDLDGKAVAAASSRSSRRYLLADGSRQDYGLANSV